MNASTFVRGLLVASIMMAPFAVAAEKDRSLVAHYTFDKGAGKRVLDRSGKGHHGIVKGAEFAAMKEGYAMSFDGMDAAVGCASKEALNMGTRDFSVELWMKLDRPLRAVMIGKQGADWSSRGWRVSYGDRGESVEFGMADGKEFADIQAPLTDSKWHHVVAVRTGNTAIIYLDGKERDRATSPVFAANVSTDTPLLLGRLSGWGRLAGKLDEVRLLKRVLTPEEVTARYEALKDKMKLAETKGTDDADDDEDDI